MMKMETKFNFNSQICTSIDQSRRLLALGLKKETADMTWEFSHTKNGEPQYDCRAESSWDSETFARYVEHCEKIGYFEQWKHEDGSQMTPEEVYDEIMKIHIPAWSLGRLIEMIPVHVPFSLSVGHLCINRERIFYWGEEVVFEWWDNGLTIYDNIIGCIEWLIKEGYFNKEYLCEK